MTVLDAPASLAEMSSERLEAEICALAARRAADECQWLLLIAEFDRRESYAAWECTSAAQWLNWHCGLSMHAGRERVRVARALEHLPVVREELGAGRLSYSKARAITRVATEATEEGLVSIGLAGTAVQLERTCAAYRRMSRPDEIENTDALADRQQLSSWHDEDGLWMLRAGIVPEDGALVDAAIASACEHLAAEQTADDPATAPQVDEGACRGAVPAGTSSGRPSRFAGLVEMARSYLSNHSVSPEVERRHLVVLVDVGVVSARGDLGIDTAGRCTLNGQRLDPDTASWLSKNAGLTQVLIDHRGLPLSVGRKSRLATPAQRLALMVRDKDRCQFPGCHSRRLVAHHITYWENYGLTDLMNLVLFCRRHHRVVHRDNLSVVLDPVTSHVDIFRPDGTAITARTPDSADAPERVAVDDHAMEPGEQGAYLDLDHILTCFGEYDRRARAGDEGAA